jgi:hypothetical protein
MILLALKVRFTPVFHLQYKINHVGWRAGASSTICNRKVLRIIQTQLISNWPRDVREGFDNDETIMKDAK